ncbi:MAG: M13 family metallopeptidase [Rhizorhabdus sp.]
MRASQIASILAPFLLTTAAFAQAPPAAATSHAELGVWGIETANISKSVRPGDGQAENHALLGESRRDWEFSWAPQTINAGYTPNYNRVEFPAAILQPPFFDPKADPAVNFGAIAAVIGHEMGHAFDDQGSATDADGKLRNWWSDASRAEFVKRSSVLVAQFNQYSPIAGVKINGAQTLGENIGDLCGMTIGYDAYHRYVSEKLGGKAPVLDGFTGDQRFFLAWAQLWRSKASDDYVRLLVQSDVHSPGQFRVNGLMRNVDGWYDAFGVKPGDALYLAPAERVRIW